MIVIGAIRAPACSRCPGGRALPPALAPGIAAGLGGWQHDDVDYILAQVNIGRMRAPLESPLLADFAAALEPVNATADAAPGFI